MTRALHNKCYTHQTDTAKSLAKRCNQLQIHQPSNSIISVGPFGVHQAPGARPASQQLCRIRLRHEYNSHLSQFSACSPAILLYQDASSFAPTMSTRKSFLTLVSAWRNDMRDIFMQEIDRSFGKVFSFIIPLFVFP